MKPASNSAAFKSLREVYEGKPERPSFISGKEMRGLQVLLTDTNSAAFKSLREVYEGKPERPSFISDTEMRGLQGLLADKPVSQELETPALSGVDRARENNGQSQSPAETAIQNVISGVSSERLQQIISMTDAEIKSRQSLIPYQPTAQDDPALRQVIIAVSDERLQQLRAMINKKLSNQPGA